jgi:DNA-binding NarL/FixJ family response regulator
MSAMPTPMAGLERLRVLVVDDLEVVQLGYRLMLCKQGWVERCLTARSIDDAVVLARRYAPHLAIVEVFVDDQPAAALIARLHQAAPGTRVLLTSSVSWMSPASVRAAGAHGFVPKNATIEKLAEAAYRVASGCGSFTPRSTGGLHVLTPREQSVLALIATGSTNREIGDELFLSPHTVKEHASSMFRTLGARNRAEAVQRAQRLGLLA